MSNSEINSFRRLLVAKRDYLLGTSSSREEIAIQTSADEIERLQHQLSREVAIRTLDNTSRVLKSIQAALDRMEDETYGVCLNCENPISEKRLKAIPWASYCATCQGAIDLERTFDRNNIGFAA